MLKFNNEPKSLNTTFGDVPLWSTFLWRNTVYLKTPQIEAKDEQDPFNTFTDGPFRINCINLSNGGYCCLSRNEVVEEVTLHVTVTMSKEY